MADHAPITRRSMLAATLALSTAAGAGAIVATKAAAAEWETVPIPPWDEDLIRRVPSIEALVQIVHDRAAETLRLSRLCGPADAALRDGAVRTAEAWDTALAAWERCLEGSGYNAANAARESAEDDLDAALTELAVIPARTLAGLRIKARFSGHCIALTASIVDDLLALDGLGMEA